MATSLDRKGPEFPDGIRRIHVGCGPHNILPDWWNVDIRPFHGIDRTLDVTEPWPWRDLDYIFGEHFLEHLHICDAVKFLTHAQRALAPGGRLRLSTPALEWVLKTHFTFDSDDRDRSVKETLRTNRAFYGWGHRFLWSRATLEQVLSEVGFVGVEFLQYGESRDAQLCNLERHRRGADSPPFPSVWVVEASPGESHEGRVKALQNLFEDELMKYTRSGH